MLVRSVVSVGGVELDFNAPAVLGGFEAFEVRYRRAWRNLVLVDQWERGTVTAHITIYDDRSMDFRVVGQPTDDYTNYSMRRIQRLVVNGDFRAARPPMIDKTFKGIGFTNVCPFTYGARGLTYIHFEKDIISHLEKVFKHSNTGYAIDIAKDIKLPEGDRANKTYEIDPRLIGLFQLSGANDPMDKEVYKNKDLPMVDTS